MTYRETMEAARQYDISSSKLCVAEEFEILVSGTDLAISEQAFELACSKIERAYLKSEDLSINAIATAMLYALLDNNTLEDIDFHYLITEACYLN
jgi:hypothetical protein